MFKRQIIECEGCSIPSALEDIGDKKAHAYYMYCEACSPHNKKEFAVTGPSMTWRGM